MSDSIGTPTCYVGLDVHKHYIIAVGVNRDRAQVFGPQRVEMSRLEQWARKRLTKQDAVVLEMTTNAYEIYDALSPLGQSVTIVHPPKVALVTRVPVKTDQKAALTLAQLHAVGMLEGIWVPPVAVRDLRALLGERRKLTRMSTQMKNRLHSVLHRCRVIAPPGDPFSAKNREWWEQLPLSALERTRVRGYFETLAFIERQIATLDASLAEACAQDERLPLLVQLPGVGFLTAITLLAAIGVIDRFPGPRQLVGYAGLGARVHDSGQTHRTGKITKAGRRELRAAMVESAQTAVQVHPRWKELLARLEPRLGRNKAIVAIARKLLVVVWHVLTDGVVDRFAEPQQVARSMFALAYRVGLRNLPGDSSTAAFTRRQLDRLRLGADLKVVPWGSRTLKLPPSTMANDCS